MATFTLFLKDLENRDYTKYGENLDKADTIKKIMEEEAFKPLFLCVININYLCLETP